MFEAIAIRILKFFDDVKQTGFLKAFQKTIFFHTEWVPVVKNLDYAKPGIQPFYNQKFKLVELTKGSFDNFRYSYRYKSRLLKARRNLNNGFKAFAIVSNDIVVGDIWYVTWEATHHPRLHAQADLLFLNPGKKDVYMFDMFIDPQERGKNLSVGLMGCALYNLGQCGYKNAFGCFNIKNIPALWMHRILKFTELEHVFYSRYLFKRFSRKMAAPS